MNFCSCAITCDYFGAAPAGIRKCEAEYDLDSLAIRRLDTGAPLGREAIGDWIRECRHKGARFGGDAKAREASIAEVRAFLSDLFSR